MVTEEDSLLWFNLNKQNIYIFFYFYLGFGINAGTLL